jgi:acyl carrier protein
MTDDAKNKVRAFIRENFLVGSDTALGDEDSLLTLQIVDSTGFLELVQFLETSFGITVGDAEMVPENLETIESIAQFLARKRAA